MGSGETDEVELAWWERDWSEVESETDYGDALVGGKRSMWEAELAAVWEAESKSEDDSAAPI